MKLSVAICLLVIVEITIAEPQDEGISNAIEGISNAIDVTTESNSTPLDLTCVTGKSITGYCVKRERCDFGTSAIDFTLYQPRGFKPICSSGEVCCPQDSLVQQDIKTWDAEKEAFEFDDDD